VHICRHIHSTYTQEKEKYTAIIAYVPALGIAINIIEWETVGTHKVVVVVTLNRQVGSAGVMFPSPCGHVHMGGSLSVGCCHTPLTVSHHLSPSLHNLHGPLPL